jgi:retron-type reverse transcriptase
METRIGTTRTTSAARAPSADKPERHHADFSFEELVQAYLDCRRTKRSSASAMAFEMALERNLFTLYEDLQEGTYRPGRSICFVITRPKPREVWAADFRDRIVHHLLYNRIAPRFYAGFIADSCACIPGRGTLYGAQRLEAKIRSLTQNWSRPAYYLKLDVANFFVSINKPIVRELLARRITEPWWMDLAEQVLFHDPREDFELRGSPELLDRVPAHKRLTAQPPHLGLPIGNLSSQFFANVLLDALDQHIKHDLRCRHYVRYVDDMVLLHESPQWLNAARADIEAWLPANLALRLNPAKTILQPVDRGVDFVGQVIRPWRRTSRKRTVNEALSRVRQIDAANLFETANSYFGLFRQATHGHRVRARLANVLRYRGHSIKADLTKTYRTKGTTL